jgi:hypothetical protein
MIIQSHLLEEISNLKKEVNTIKQNFEKLMSDLNYNWDVVNFNQNRIEENIFKLLDRVTEIERNNLPTKGDEK